jgi:hypothetical protein
LEDCSIADCTELSNVTVNETNVQKNMEFNIDAVCEDDDHFEIAVLNNRQLEIKTITI